MTIKRALEALRFYANHSSWLTHGEISSQVAKEAIQKLTKPCETCGGEEEICERCGLSVSGCNSLFTMRDIYCLTTRVPCPNNCIDGRVPL